MRRTLGKIKQTISVLLAAAMMITALPQTSVSVQASEVQNVLDESGGAGIAQDTAGESGSDQAAPVDGTQQDEADSGAQENSKETGGESDAGEPETGTGTETGQPGIGDGTDVDGTQGGDGADVDKPQGGDSADVDKPQGGDGADVDKPQGGDGTDVDGTQDDDGTNVDETQDGDGADVEQEPGIDADIDESLAGDEEETDETADPALATEEDPDPGTGEEVTKINVNFTLPYYTGEGWTPLLKEFSYAIGEDSEFTPVALEENGNAVSSYKISVEAGKSLKFKLACADNARLKNVSWKGKSTDTYYPSYSNEEVMEEVDGVYTLEISEQNDQVGMVGSYEITINALQIWNITFVDMYARDHENAASVKVGWIKTINAYEEETIDADITGKTITVDSEEWNRSYFTVNANEGFTFDSIASASYITINKHSDKTNGYRLERDGYGRTPTDFSIFVTAEPSQQKKITLNMPAEVTDAMQVEVYGKSPSQSSYEKLEVTDGVVAVQDDMQVRVDVTSSNKSYMVQATYQETGGEPEPFAESDIYTVMNSREWIRRYTLGALNHITDGITVNLSRVSTKKVGMTVDWAAVRGISVSTPYGESFSAPSEGEEERKITVYVPEKEALKFYVEMEKNKGTAFVSAEDGGEIGIAGYDKDYYGNQGEPYYLIDPASDMNISVKGREFEYRFAYPQDDVSILVYESEDKNGPSGDPLELTDNCYHSYRDDNYLWVRVKPNAGKDFSVWYDRKSDGYRIDVDYESMYDKTEEDGSTYFCYGPIDKDWLEDNPLTIETYHTNTVTFQTEYNLSFQEMEYDRDNDDFYGGDWIEDSISVREGEDLYFRVDGDGYNSNIHRLLISMKGTDRDSLESRWNDEDMEDYLIYHLVPAADTTITFTVEERKQCEVVIEKSDAVKAFYVEYKGDNGWAGNSTVGTYKVREDGYVTISQLTPAGSEAEAAAKKGKVAYQIGEETYEVSPEYDLDSQEPVYRIKVTDNMKVMIDVQDIAQYTISFKDDSAQLENIRVWELGTYNDKDNLYNAQTGTATVADNGYYYADFQLKDGVGLSSVTVKDSAGSEKVLARTYLEEDGEMGYRIGMLRGNMEIVPELVSGYTVKFDLGKLSAEDAAALTIYDSYSETEVIIGQEKGQDIGSRKISAAAAESSSFYLPDWRRYKLTLDSELFALTKVYQADEYANGDYAYVISPKQTAELPGVVTVSLEKYAEHQVTLESSDVIRSISLGTADGISFKPVENQTDVYKVYGEGIVLTARAIDGYSPVVKIKGTTEGAEATELTPYKDDGGRMEYYLGEITEDKIIQVTVVRSTQRKTYYRVGFLCEGGHAEVRDTAYGTLYILNTEEEYYGPDYSILKGSKVSFYVEPYFGYELRGVYANGERLQPVRDAASSRDLYEVTPAGETQIKIDVAKTAPKYPLTFRWTNTEAVKSVKVQGYELQNNRIDVAAGEKISFSVELTDAKYSITSVTMNGQEVPYSAGSGSYTLTALKEPMNVQINADVADKIIRFSNTLENAQYEVETNELIRFRNENTYLASGNAELLKFTVKVPDKALKVGVTYVNQSGLKENLKEKAQTDLGEQGVSYSYEIAVAQLPLESEITISGAGAVPAGDKTELETAVVKYEGYKKSDYTEESWTAFEEALKAAQDCMKKENATQEEIDAAFSKLQSAAAALVKKGDTPVDPDDPNDPDDPDDPDDPGPNAPDGLWIKAIPDVTYTGTAYKPAVKVYNGRTLLTEKKDYTVAYKNNVKAGKAVVTVNGKGNYKAKDTAEFNILKKNINDEDIVIEDVYAVIKANGTVTNPKVAVKFGKKALRANSDYKVIYPELEKGADGQIVPKTYKITISTAQVKKKGSGYLDAENFIGEREINYTVCPAGALLMGSAKITLDKTKVDYKGAQGVDTEKPKVTSVKIGKTTLTEADYTVSYENWDQAGTAAAIVTAKDSTNYFGSKAVTYTVNGTKLAAGQLEVTGLDDKSYTGQPIYVSNHPVTGAAGTMKVKMSGKTLTEGTDYTVSYKTGRVEGAHTDVGTVDVTITGINAYSGTVKKSFKITPYHLEDYSKSGAALTFSVEGDGKAKYTKNGARPAFTLSFNDGEKVRKLVEKTDYTVTYANNTKINSNATMTIKGKGSFAGTIPYSYTVTAASESDVYVVPEDIVVPDQFKKLKTTVKVMEIETGKALKAGTDYDKDIKYYTDATCTTEITADNFSSLNLRADSRVYVKVVMKTGGCYAGTTAGEKVASFRLYDKDKKISVGSKFVVEVKTGETADGTKINCEKGNPIYTGKPIEPKVVVTPKGGGTPLTEGTDYKVTYSNNVNKGNATVTVTAIGREYGGSKSMKFKIVPSDMSWVKKAGAAAQKAVEIFSEMIMQN